jgi:hypothetical protein
LATKGTVREARGLTSDACDLVVLDRELDIHQPDHLERPGEATVCRSISAMILSGRL